MSGQTVKVTIPADLYERLSRQARQRRRSVEDEVVLALATAVPADDDIPSDVAATLRSMVALDDDTLLGLAQSRVAEEAAARLDELGDKRQRIGLNEAELREAEDLLQQHDRVMLVRAEAAALLKQRDHDVSNLLNGA